MKIKFYGTSHGLPEVGRFCSSARIEVNGALYFIDAGAPIINLLINDGRHPSEVRAMFITHCHGDHINGLPHFIDLSHWYYSNVNVKVFVPEENVIENIYTYVQSLKGGTIDKDRLCMLVTPEGHVYEDENIKVTSVPTGHFGYERPAYSYRVEAEGKRVIFTGDLSHGLSLGDFPKIACEVPSDIVICEKAHYGMGQLMPYLENLPTKELWFNHVNSSFDELREMDGKYPFAVKIANDGDEIVL